MSEPTEEQIEAYVKATLAPHFRENPRAVASQRIQAKAYFDRVSLYGQYDVLKSEYK